MAMEFDAQYDWANNAFLALNGNNSNSNSGMGGQLKWPAFSAAPEQSFPPSTFTMPTLLTHAAVERFGQVTPPEEQSPAIPPTNSPLQQGQSAKDITWLSQQQKRDLASFDPMAQQLQQQQPEVPAQNSDSGRSSKRRRSTKQTTANETPAPQQLQNATPPQDPQPPKRKRGRPKSQPQAQEGFNAEGYPFPVSSARESHLEKNRVAAHKCRQRRKEYINSLETRSREFSTKNRELKEQVNGLREEVLNLKNVLLRHAGCGCWAIDEYLAQCAGDLLGVKNPFLQRSNSQRPDPSPQMSTIDRDASPSVNSFNSPQVMSDYAASSRGNEFDDLLISNPDDEDNGSPV